MSLSEHFRPCDPHRPGAGGGNRTASIGSALTPVASPQPHVIVLFGATGDLARRKLLPGLLHLSSAGLMPEFELVGTSRSQLDDEAFREHARRACGEFARVGSDPAKLEAFARRLTYVERWRS